MSKQFPQVLKGAATRRSKYRKATLSTPTEAERKEAYIKNYIATTLSVIEQENWKTVRHQRIIAEQMYNRLDWK